VQFVKKYRKTYYDLEKIMISIVKFEFLS